MDNYLPSTDFYHTEKAKYKKEIAEKMGYSLRTFQRKLKDANVDIPRGLVCPQKQREIFQKLGWKSPK